VALLPDGRLEQIFGAKSQKSCTCPAHRRSGSSGQLSKLGVFNNSPMRTLSTSFARLPDNASDDASYFFLSEAKVGCYAEAFWLGAAAITLIFSLGFLGSRFPLC